MVHSDAESERVHSDAESERVTMDTYSSTWLTIGEAIKAKQEMLGLTGEELANLLGIDDGQLSGIKSGKRQPSKDVLSRLVYLWEDMRNPVFLYLKEYYEIKHIHSDAESERVNQRRILDV